MLKSLRTLTLVLLAFIAGGLITLDAAGVTRISFGTALPTNCVAGNVFVKTSATTGVYWCSTPGSPGTWTAVGGGGTGDVVGPSSATADRIAVFDGTTGKLLKDGGQTIAGITGGSGKVVQVVNTQTGAVATGTTVIPFDNTIPQNTEGDQYMSLAITPTSASNILKIDVVFFGTSSQTNWITVALFQDSTANALAAFANFQVTVTAGNNSVFTHYMTAGTTSSTTFKVRAGRDASAAGTVTFNGQSGGRIFGGVMASSITITELAP